MSAKNPVFYRRYLPHYQPPDAIFFVTFRLAGSFPKQMIEKMKMEKEKELTKINKIIDIKIKKSEIELFRFEYFSKFDEILGKINDGPVWLKDERIANIVKDAIEYRDNKEYSLITYCIMPNHVHMVFKPIIKENTVVRSAASHINKNGRSGASSYNINNVTSQGIITDGQNSTVQYTVVRSATSHINKNGRSNTSSYIVTKILQNLKAYTAREANKILNRSGAFLQKESYDHIVRDYEELNRVNNYVALNPVKAGLIANWEEWKWTKVNDKYLSI